MALQLGDEAPDFTTESTEGPISFHDYLGNGWESSSRIPAGFPPVCTTELGKIGPVEARVREAQHQGRRAFRRPGRLAQELGE